MTFIYMNNSVNSVNSIAPNLLSIARAPYLNKKVKILRNNELRVIEI
jgi:hypothetical protein